MLKTALFLFLVSIIAAAFGFTGIAGAAAGLAKIIFFVALILAVIVIGMVVLGVKAVT